MPGAVWLCLLWQTHENVIDPQYVCRTNFLVTKQTSALTLQVLGNVKGVLGAAISIALFRNPITAIGCVGYTMTVGGVFGYSQVHSDTICCLYLQLPGSVSMPKGKGSALRGRDRVQLLSTHRHVHHAGQTACQPAPAASGQREEAACAPGAAALAAAQVPHRPVTAGQATPAVQGQHDALSPCPLVKGPPSRPIMG